MSALRLSGATSERNYRIADIYDGVSTDEPVGVVLRLRCSRLLSKVKNSFHQEGLRKVETNKGQTRKDASQKCPLIVKDEDPKKGKLARLVSCDSNSLAG